MRTIVSLACVLTLALFVNVLPAAPAGADDATFTLVGTVDGGLPSGQQLDLGAQIVVVSDESGVARRYVIDLSWLHGKLPPMNQDDLLQIDVQQLPDGSFVAVSVTNSTDRKGTENDGQTTGSRRALEQPRAENERQTSNVAGPDATATATATPTPSPTAPVTTSTATATPTGTVTATPGGSATATPTGTVTATPGGSVTATATSAPGVPTIQWTVSAQALAENAGSAIVTAQLSAVAGADVTVVYTVTGSATAGGGADFTVAPASPLTILAGQTAVNVTVTINNDGASESDETVVLTLSAPTNATLGGTTVHTVTIQDNDPLAAADTYAATGNVQLTVPVGAGGCGQTRGVLCNDTLLGGAIQTFGPTTGLETAVGGTGATALGGTITLQADGSFVYNPPVGVTATNDSFQYRLVNSASSSTGAATITLTDILWFVDNNAGACVSGCDGRLTHPFASLAALEAANGGVNGPATGELIFLYESATSYAGPLTLLNGQRLIGQDATSSLAAIAGFTPPTGSATLPTLDSGNGVGVTLEASGANNIVNLASSASVTVRGLTIGNRATGVGISANGFGTLTVSETTISGTGRALSLTNGALAATFDSIASTTSAGAAVIALDTITSGALTVTNGTTITNAAAGISASSVAATVNFGDTAITSTGDGVAITSSASGTFTFDDLDVTASAGVGLSASSAGTVNVDTDDNDSPTLSATTRPALNIVNTTIRANLASLTSSNSTTNGVNLTTILAGSTLGVSGATTITAPTSSGVQIDGVATGSSLVFGAVSVTSRGTHGIFIQDHVGAAVTFGDVDITNGLSAGGNGVHVQKSGPGASTGPITFASLDISSTNATVNRTDAGGDGIPDNETDDGHAVRLIDHTGGLTVTGDGTQGNGGTIQNIEGDGFSLIRSGGLNLDEMTINNIGTSNQAAASVDNAGVYAVNLVGTNRVSNSTISRFQDGSVGGGASRGVSILNSDVTFTEFRTTDVTFFNDNSLLGDDAISLTTNGSVNGALIVESAFALGNVNNNSEFFQVSGHAVQVQKNGGGALTVSISDTTFRDTITSSGFGGIDLASVGSGTMSSTIDECLFLALYPGGVNNSGVITLTAGGTVDFDATVNNSTFGSGSQRTSDGRGAIRAATDMTGVVTDFDITITNNSIDDTAREAISIFPRGEAAPAASGQEMDIVITGNVIGATTAVANDAGIGREGIEFVATDNAKIINLLLQNNTVINFVDSSSDETVDIDIEDSTTVNVIVRGNTFNQTGSPGTADSIDIATEDASASTCLDMNSANTSGNVAPHGIVITETAGTFSIEDIGGAANAAATVDTFIEARNTGSATVTGTFDSCNDH